MVNPVSRSANYTAPQAVDRVVRLAIPLEMAGLRLDQALARLLPEQSRSRLAKLIEEGHVLLDGEACGVRRKLKSGETVEVTLAPRAAEEGFRAEEIPLA